MFETHIHPSRFIAFFDKYCGHIFSEVNPTYILCMILVEREMYAHVVVPEMTSFKLRYFVHEGVNLHGRSIRRSEGSFLFLRDKVEGVRFINDLLFVISRLPFTLFAVSIRECPNDFHYNSNTVSPFDVALEHLFDGVLCFMEVTQEEIVLPIVTRTRSINDDNLLRGSLYRIMTEGVGYCYADQSCRLVCPVSFQHKRDNIIGIQLADLCLHSIIRKLLRPAEANSIYAVIEPKFYCNGTILSQG